MANSKLPCSQNAFVSTTNLCIDLLILYVIDLMTIKPKYTVAFFQDLRADLQAADLMSDDKTRRAYTADATLILDADRAALIKLLLFLKAYIEDTFEKSRWDNLYTQAGFDYLTKAKSGNWTSMTGLISSAVPFLEENKVALMANDTMPPTFIETFNAAVAKLKTSYSAWLALSKGMSKAEEKVSAFNEVNTRLSAALKVAYIFYEDTNPALANQFLFQTQLSQVQGTKNAGINGRVQKADKKAVPSLVISIQGIEKTVTCDDDGRYEFTPLSMGKYTVTFTAAGFVTQTFTDEVVKTGVMTRLNVKMVAEG